MNESEFRYQDTTAPDPHVLAALCGEMGRIEPGLVTGWSKPDLSCLVYVESQRPSGDDPQAI